MPRTIRQPVLVLLPAVVLCLAPGLAAADDSDFFGEGFEAFTGIPATTASRIDRDELEDLRGRFLGFYFSVSFGGFVDPDGASFGTLTVNAGVDQNAVTLVLDGGGNGGGAPLGQPVAAASDFRVSAGIGDAFGGAQGVFQISQIPGSNVSLRQALVVNIAVIQAAPSDLSAVQTQLAPLFGL